MSKLSAPGSRIAPFSFVGGAAVGILGGLIGLARYSGDRRFVVVRENPAFVLAMALGSVIGTFVGGQLLGLVPPSIFLPMLALILVLSAMKVWRHE